jgi:oligopeptide/dipeptide ABC transporter ATP-binding protein
MAALLKVLDLHVQFTGSEGRTIRALNGASLEIQPGEMVGLLGESGSGKSTFAKALMQLLPKDAQSQARAMEFEGEDLLKLSEREMNGIRGGRMSIIPQEPGQALNPTMKVGDQVTEVLRAHRHWTSKECRREADRLLERVNLTGPERRTYEAYPHQLSGGQQQRVAIAQAVACQPSLIIADEPTASLDVATESEILQLLSELRESCGMSLLLITHDPTILHGLVHRAAVMYGGRIIEDGPIEQVIRVPRHPYTKALLASISPTSGEGAHQSARRFPTIPGSSPDPELAPSGCAFAPRCSMRMEKCDVQRPAPVNLEKVHHVECFLYGN